MKYDLAAFKQAVISYYHEGHSFKAVTKHFPVGVKDVMKWVKQYEHGGVYAKTPKDSLFC